MLLKLLEGGWVSRVPAAALMLNVIEHFSGELDVVVGELANLGVVNTQHLGVLGGSDTQTRDEVDNEQNEAGASERVGTASNGIGDLVAELDPVVVEPASVDTG